MTSSQPVTTPNAIVFTPDNKHAYAYSGALTITSGSYATGLEFSTNSEYILAKFQIVSDDTTGSDLYYKINVNGVDLLIKFNKNPNATDPVGFSPIEFVIPPFSDVIISAQRGSGSDYTVFMLLSGEAVGMVDVGYQ